MPACLSGPHSPGEALKTVADTPSSAPWSPTVSTHKLPSRPRPTCAQTMVIASHCVGLTLPGMMEDPGSFSGRHSSPRPQRGPEPRKRMSLATFIRDTAICRAGSRPGRLRSGLASSRQAAAGRQAANTRARVRGLAMPAHRHAGSITIRGHWRSRACTAGARGPHRVERPVHLHHRVVRRQRLKLVGRGDKGVPRVLRHRRRHLLGKALLGVQPRAHGWGGEERTQGGLPARGRAAAGMVQTIRTSGVGRLRGKAGRAKAVGGAA